MNHSMKGSKQSCLWTHLRARKTISLRHTRYMCTNFLLCAGCARECLRSRTSTRETCSGLAKRLHHTMPSASNHTTHRIGDSLVKRLWRQATSARTVGEQALLSGRWTRHRDAVRPSTLSGTARASCKLSCRSAIYSRVAVPSASERARAGVTS